MKITRIAMRWLQFKTDMWFYNTFDAIEQAIRKNGERNALFANRLNRCERQYSRIERRLLALEVHTKLRTEERADESANLLPDTKMDNPAILDVRNQEGG